MVLEQRAKVCPTLSLRGTVWATGPLGEEPKIHPAFVSYGRQETLLRHTLYPYPYLYPIPLPLTSIAVKADGARSASSFRVWVPWIKFICAAGACSLDHSVGLAKKGGPPGRLAPMRLGVLVNGAWDGGIALRSALRAPCTPTAPPPVCALCTCHHSEAGGL